ncbi:protease pro-enzyme activation domain-containing protein [Granulicella cerasi]|uniref:Protease pro-enzyme activation domain-containing protein n=1 Tax=Granulicella cerasi TaxID=741063 RepID=A0ABW1Z8A9_9BACT
MVRNRLYRSLKAGIALALGSLCPAALVAQSAAPVRLVTAAVNNSDRIALAGSLRKDLAHATDLGTASTSLTARNAMIVLERSAAQEADLEQYLGDVQNASSPSFHKWLTPAEYGARFGASSDDIAAITGWLQSQGLTVVKTSPAANVIVFSGSVGQLQNAFATTIHQVSLNGEKHLTALTEPKLPRALAPAVKGVLGLDDFRPHPYVQKAPTATYNATTKRIEPDFTLFSSAGTPYLYLDPADAATVYNTPNANLNPNYTGTTYDGTGITVGVVGDSNFATGPVSNYRQAFLGETTSTLNMPTVVIDGVDPGINGDEIETFLDLEVLGGIAPKAKINYYASADSDISNGLFNAIQRAVNDNAVSILSVSFGACEAGLGTATNGFIAETYKQAAAQGITVLVSSGDAGAATCDSSAATTATHGLAVNGLSSTPYNISVGGTDFYGLLSGFTTYVDTTTSGSAPYYRTAKSYIPERPWNDSTSSNGALANNVAYSASPNIIGGGGGKSIIYSKPAFQSALTPADGARDLPDVSFLAGNGFDGAVWVICETSSIYGDNCATSNGQIASSARFSGAGGTSASTPAFAGMLALVEQSIGARLGAANNVIYKLASTKYSTVFHDITAGNNSVVCTANTTNCGSNGFLTGYDATTGYDLATGLGSVNAAALLQNWSSGTGTASTTAFTINGSTAAVSVTHGTSLTFGVNVNPTTATGDVGIVNTATASSSSSSTLNGTPYTLTLANGAATGSYNGLPGGQYTVYANYGGDSSTASSKSSAISVNIAAENSSTLLWANAYTPLQATISNLNAIPYGSYVFLETSVYGTAEGYTNSLGYATGTVTYLDGGKSIGTAAMTSGNFASFPSSTSTAYSFTPGTHTVTATYPGDASYKANTSNTLNFTVVKGNTTAVLYANSATVTSTTTDNIEIDVETSSLATAPTGTITLTANGTTLGTSSTFSTGNLRADNTVVSYVIIPVAGSSLVSGSNTLTATYSGDSNYNGSTGTVTITDSFASFTMASGAIAINAGATIGNTATVSVTPTGNFAGLVNLKCAVTTAPANAVSPVTCSIPTNVNVTGTGIATTTVTAVSTSTTTGGAYAITITGTDAASGKIVQTAVSNVTVTAAPGITLANSAAITLTAGATTGNTSTLTMSPTNGFTGIVNLSCAVTSTPSGASASYPITCGVAPTSVTISGITAQTATLSINSTARKTASLRAA